MVSVSILRNEKLKVLFYCKRIYLLINIQSITNYLIDIYDFRGLLI